MSAVQTSALSLWLSADGLAAYLGITSRNGARGAAKAARMWAHRAGVVAVHRGRRVLYLRADVDRVLLAQRDADLALLRKAG